MMQMFLRVYELIGQLRETLRSRELWTDDDDRAFAALVREQKLDTYAVLARAEYVQIAQSLGVRPSEDPQQGSQPMENQ